MSDMTFTDYQGKAGVTAKYPEVGTGSPMALAYVGLGLAGEAGEVADKIKKVLRDNNGEFTPEVLAAIAVEVGDVLWYAQAFATEAGMDFQDIAEGNIVKLYSRLKRDVISGSGDSR